MILLIYLILLTQFLIFKITLNLYQKTGSLYQKTENLPVQIYPSKIKNIIFFKIKTGYKLELLTPETTRLLGSTKKDVDTNKNSENVLKLESVEVVLLHCYLVKNDYQHSSKALFSSK